jgi:hypothetical protein
MQTLVVLHHWADLSGRIAQKPISSGGQPDHYIHTASTISTLQDIRTASTISAPQDVRTASSISAPQARYPHRKLCIRTASSISAPQARYPHRKLDTRTASSISPPQIYTRRTGKC